MNTGSGEVRAFPSTSFIWPIIRRNLIFAFLHLLCAWCHCSLNLFLIKTIKNHFQNFLSKIAFSAKSLAHSFVCQPLPGEMNSSSAFKLSWSMTARLSLWKKLLFLALRAWRTYYLGLSTGFVALYCRAVTNCILLWFVLFQCLTASNESPILIPLPARNILE